MSTMLTYTSFAQTVPQERSLYVNKTDEHIEVDGILDEITWSLATVSGNFMENFPSDTSLASSQTEVRMAYDKDNLYVSVKCFDLVNGPYNIESLRRDFSGSENDMVVVVIDPFLDKTSGFVFGISPFGTMKEGLVYNGENSDYSWDNKWFGESKVYEDFWVAEMAIPFKTLRFKEGAEKWNTNVYRIDTKQGERSSWVAIPKSFKLASLAFTGSLLWEEPLGKPGANVVFIPFVSAGLQKDHLKGTPTEENFSIGGDVKVGLTPSLNLDLTINPDFSQVEVDDQVTDLSRFEIFFDEKRQFFIENADLFASFGSDNSRPFFSRRIGIAYDSATRQNVQNPIMFGARMSGKINNNWRVGLLSVQTAKDDEINLPSQNHSVAVLQRKVFGRSNISALFVNKQPFLRSNRDASGFVQGYNRVAGLEYNLASENGRWTGKFYYHQSFEESESNGKQSLNGSILQYKNPYLTAGWSHEYVGEDFNAEIGYIPRKDFYRINPFIKTFTYPGSSLINRHGPGVGLNAYWNTAGELMERTINLTYEIYFQDISQLKFEASNYEIKLFNDFDPTKSGGEKLLAGATYQYSDFKIEFLSDKRKKFYYNLISQNGQYFNGRRVSFSGNLNYRIPPKAIFSLVYAYNRINMPEPYFDVDIWLLGPKIDLTLRKNLYYTTTIQYNNQIDNVNINSRFQWRFKPVSDLFIVYSDNYFSESLISKNRALVLKLNYWLNI